jgi:hypothetical protein
MAPHRAVFLLILILIIDKYISSVRVPVSTELMPIETYATVV